jgi:hypothetical protein
LIETKFLPHFIAFFTTEGFPFDQSMHATMIVSILITGLIETGIMGFRDIEPFLWEERFCADLSSMLVSDSRSKLASIRVVGRQGRSHTTRVEDSESPIPNSATAQLRPRVCSRSSPGSPSSSTDVGNHWANLGEVQTEIHCQLFPVQGFEIHRYRERDNITKYVCPKTTDTAQMKKKNLPVYAQL